MGNVSYVRDAMTADSYDTRQAINKRIAKAAFKYMHNSHRFPHNTNTKYVVLILITEINGELHAIFHIHGRENVLGFIAGKVDPLDPERPSAGREKPHYAMFRETFEESGLILSLHHTQSPAYHTSGEVEIIDEIVQKSTTVFVARTTRPDSLDLSLHKSMCIGSETKDIIAVPLSVVQTWTPTVNVPLSGLSEIGLTPDTPRKFAIDTILLLQKMIAENRFDTHNYITTLPSL